MDHSQEIFSPKQVATAIGVSESSLKRWCDAGKIASIKTTGGHRRMTAADVVSFTRMKKMPLKHPTAIGLPGCDVPLDSDPMLIQRQLFRLLIEGDAEKCRELLVQSFVNLWPIERIGDEIVRPVFLKIGQRFADGELEIYQERRACDICLSAFREIRSLIPSPRSGAPLAIGGSPENDHYSLPTYAVELTLAAQGWNANSIGSNLPFKSFHEAVRIERPRLLWMSISNLVDEPVRREQFQSEVNRLATQLPPDVAFVIGGQAITEDFRVGLKSVTVCDNLSQLVASTKNVRSQVSFI